MAAPDLVASNLYAEAVSSLRRDRTAASRELVNRTLVVVETMADFLACLIGIFAANVICAWLSLAPHVERASRQTVTWGIVVAVFVVFLQLRDGAYGNDSGLLQIRETERAIRIPFQALSLAFIIDAIIGGSFPLGAFLAAVVVIPVLLILERRLLLKFEHIFQRRDGWAERVVVYGAGDTGRRVLSVLLQSPRLGMRPIALIDPTTAESQRSILPMGYRCRQSIPLEQGPITPALLKSLRADLLLVATQHLSPEQVMSFGRAAYQAGSEIALLTCPAIAQEQNQESINISGLQFTLPRERRESWHYATFKRMLDLLLSSVLFILLAPLLLVIAMLICFDSPGPALFVQQRVGRNGVLFNMYKFRSMYQSAPRYEASPTSSRDRRITRIGRILRSTSIDELPQLINVLLGDMSLVGPRPEMPFIADGYNDLQRQRLQVMPGITGLWQLSADRVFPIHQNIQYDLYYIRNRNIFMDAAILIHTFLYAMRGGI